MKRYASTMQESTRFVHENSLCSSSGGNRIAGFMPVAMIPPKPVPRRKRNAQKTGADHAYTVERKKIPQRPKRNESVSVRRRKRVDPGGMPRNGAARMYPNANGKTQRKK